MKHWHLGLALVLMVILAGPAALPLSAQDDVEDEVSTADKGDGGTVNQPTTGMIAGVPNTPEYNGCAAVREGPDTKSKGLGGLPNGTTVEIGGYDGNWTLITSPTKGYVWTTLIKVTGSKPVPKNDIVNLQTAVVNAAPERTLKGITKHNRPQFMPRVSGQIEVPSHVVLPPTGAVTASATATGSP